MPNTTNFSLIGAAGYIAPRHFQAIRDTGNRLVAAMDIHDSVGVLDNYFPGARFFTSPDDLAKFMKDARGGNEQVDYVSVCSPNHLHPEHIRLALSCGASAICEKPLCLEESEALALKEIAQKEGLSVSTILQLRLHPVIAAIRERCASGGPFTVDVVNISPRGKWYHASWKGDQARSGGIATNIGIHLFDMLIWIFGSIREQQVYIRTDERAAGSMELERAHVRWYLSIASEDLPEPGIGTFRRLTLNGEPFDFSAGFAELHTKSYSEILAGRGFDIDITLPSIKACEYIRNAPLSRPGKLGLSFLESKGRTFQRGTQ